MVHSVFLIDALSGAIDLAAKSAGIIPGSPCRDLDSLAVNAAVLAATPIVDAAPDTQLLQQNVPVVRSEHLPVDLIKELMQ